MSDNNIPHDAAQVKQPPFALSDAEILRLMRVFTKGKRQVLEDDCVLLTQWAQQMKVSGMLLEMVLDGELTPVIEHGEVKLSLPTNVAGRGD
jgi:hypothetical protein